MLPGPSFLYRVPFPCPPSPRRPYPRAHVRRVRLGNGGGAFAPWKTARGGRKAPNSVSHSAKAPHASLRAFRPPSARSALGAVFPLLAIFMRFPFEPEPADARFVSRIALRIVPVLTLGDRASCAVVNRVRALQESPCGFPWRGRTRGVAPSAPRPPVRQDGRARLDAHFSSPDLISQQRGRVAPVAEISEPLGERSVLGNPSARRALSASGVRRRRLLTPPTRSRFPVGDRFPCSALLPFASRPSRGRPLPGRASGRGARNRRHGKTHGAHGKPLTRFPTTAAVRGRRSGRAPFSGCCFVL